MFLCFNCYLTLKYSHSYLIYFCKWTIHYFFNVSSDLYNFSGFGKGESWVIIYIPVLKTTTWFFVSVHTQTGYFHFSVSAFVTDIKTNFPLQDAEAGNCTTSILLEFCRIHLIFPILSKCSEFMEVLEKLIFFITRLSFNFLEQGEWLCLVKLNRLKLSFNS